MPILSSGTKTRKWIETDINSLTAAQMRVEEQRSIHQKSKNKRKNTGENLKLNTLESKLKPNRAWLNRRILRMEENRIPETVLVWKRKGKAKWETQDDYGKNTLEGYHTQGGTREETE